MYLMSTNNKKCLGSGQGNTSPDPKKKYSNICFTIFPEKGKSKEMIKHWRDNREKWGISYLIMGREKCPDTGRTHLQCYCEFEKQIRFTGIKKIDKTMHFEPRYGTQKQAIDYCKKDNKFFEFGVPKSQGERCDLDEIKEEILNGKTVDEVTIEKPILYHQYGRTLDKLQEIAFRKKFRTWMTSCDWYFGKTGTGKSHKAFEGFTPDTHYVKNLNTEFWDGYTGQETVILNEFRGQIKFSELLDLIDKYPKTVNIKSKPPVPFLAKHIIITSCKTPYGIYSNALDNEDSIRQLLRRINIFECFEGYAIKPFIIDTSV